MTVPVYLYVSIRRRRRERRPVFVDGDDAGRIAQEA